MQIDLKNLSDRKQKGKFKTGYLLIDNFIMRFDNKDLIGDPIYVTGSTEFEIIQDFIKDFKDEFEEDKIPKVIYVDNEGKYDAHHVLDERRLIIKKEDDDLTYDEIKDREDYIEYKYDHYVKC